MTRLKVEYTCFLFLKHTASGTVCCCCFFILCDTYRSTAALLVAQEGMAQQRPSPLAYSTAHDVGIWVTRRQCRLSWLAMTRRIHISRPDDCNAKIHDLY